MIRVLLNASADELSRLGGDFSHYRDWLALSDESLQFQAFPQKYYRAGNHYLRTGVEKACRTWQPSTLRRLLLLASRFLYIPTSVSNSCDLIFSHLLFPWPPAPSAKPIIWNSQGISPRVYYERANRGGWTVEDVAFVYKVLGARATALTVFTEACARNVVEWCPELEGKVFVVPAPVFTQPKFGLRKLSEGDGQVRLLFVGVDALRKGLREVAVAYAKVRTRFPNVTLDVVSRPPSSLAREISCMAGASLTLSSSTVNIKEKMEVADVLLIPTYADTYALAAVEALAHGCAVISSGLEPLPEVVPHGEAGFNVTAGDVKGLVDAVEALVTNRRLLRRMQQGAYALYRRRDHPDVVRASLIRVFEWALRRHRAAA